MPHSNITILTNGAFRCVYLIEISLDIFSFVREILTLVKTLISPYTFTFFIP